MPLLPIDREILRIAWPAIATNITVPLLGLVDVAIVGHIGDARYIGAIAVATMLFNVIYWLFAFLRMGTSGLTAQAYGAGDADGCRRLLRQAISIALVTAAVLFALQRPLFALAILVFDPPVTMLPLVDTYYRVAVWGMPAMLSLYALSGWFIGMQNTRATMVISIAQNIINIVMSLVFVFLLKMDIEGVALGTVLALYAGVGIGVVLLRRWGRVSFGRLGDWSFSRLGDWSFSRLGDWSFSRLGDWSFSRLGDWSFGRLGEGLKTTWSSLRPVFRVNAAIFLRTLFLVLVNMYFVAYGASMGEQTLAVNTLLMQLFMLYSYITDGFAYAGQALGGKYLGAGDGQRLRQAVKRLFLWGVGVMIVFSIVYSQGAYPILTLLTSDDNVLHAVHPYLPWICLVPLAGMAAFVWDGIFIGTTKVWGMLFATMAAAACFFALWFIFGSRWNNHALWMAFIAFLVMRGVVQTWLWMRIQPAL